MRVLFLASYFPKPENPLMGIWALKQAKALCRAGMEVRVVSMTSYLPRVFGRLGIARAWSRCPSTYDWDGLTVEYPRWPLYQVGHLKRQAFRNPLPQMSLAWTSAKPAISRIINEFQPRIVFCHHTGVNGYLGLKIKERFGLPYIITDHDFDEIDQCAIFPERKRFFAAIIREASRMITVSERMRSSMMRIFPEAKVDVLANGTDPIPDEILSQPRPTALKGKSVIFSAGYFYPRKAFPVLIRAFARIAAKYPNTLLRIAGDGEDRPSVEAACAETKLGDRVQLLGVQPNERVLQEMAWCDFFALPSWDEPFGVVYIEALSAGKPVIYSSDSGINEFLESGIHGLAVLPKDEASLAEALERMLGSAQNLKTMSVHAKEKYYSTFRWESNAKQLATWFSQAVEHTGAPTS